MAVWKLRSEEDYRKATRILSELEYADQMGYADDREALIDALRSIPGYPPHAIGEHVDLVLQKPRLFVPRGTQVPKQAAAILDIRRH